MSATHKTVVSIGGAVANMPLSPEEAQAVEAAWAANPPPTAQQMQARLRQKSADLLADLEERNALVFRAIVLVLLDELNAHTAKINAIRTAINSGSTLAAVKANIATIADYPARTAAQVRAAINGKLTAGNADA